METIFRSAVNHIHAKEDLKRKTKDYLIANLSITPTAAQSKPGRSVRQRAVLAACTVIFVGAISAAAVYKTPASYLSLDINPGVELGVNRFGKIVSATAYDNAGVTILDGQNIMDTDVKTAVHTLVKSAAQKGFVAQDGSTVILVTSETDNPSNAIELENTAAQGVETAIKSEGKTVTISKDHIPLEKRDEAKKLDITPGKLSLIQKLQALDPSVTVTEYKDVKTKDIIKKIDELKKSENANSGDTKDSPALPDNSDSDEAAGKDTPNSPGTAIDKNPQETDNGNSSVSSGESGKDTVSSSSAAPEKENSQTASSKVSSRSSSSPSSHPKR
ncbi:hypothetical protein [Caproiciproducens galactitolivorans]|uniref:Anti-sigma factor RsgI-like middle domain-containing protein n=1 Tax=Caproiciproducens galactitolivorans TaxID=642589 RepID=A0ABT4BWD5_9FIRM|nr:hypothetical protein [Caproiciproducens galactitolivorans]MCY1714368.1 hypothetical protein [Caproiciproducens galactitolivorans]